jgi:RNA polymerase sigma-70 factor (family 1)
MKIDAVIIKQLKEQIVKNDQKAFENLYRLFFTRLFNFAMLYVHKKEAAEEIVNDVMVKIWNRRDKLNTIEHLETYLFVAVRNLSLNYLEKYSHLHITITPETGEAEVINLHNPQKELEWKEISFRLTMAIEQLSEQQRTVFKLIKEEGFRYKQVAEILGISPRTVETQLFRAVKKLSAVVNAYLEKPSGEKNNSISLAPLLLLTLFSVV